MNPNITYDKKRNDITFCTMMFKIPDEAHLGSLKHMDRKFEEFYLPSLKILIETFERVALWCDHQTADYLRVHGFDKKILMREMDFTDLPHYVERDEYLRLLKNMQDGRGYLLKRKKPQEWPDYMTVIMAKPAVIKFAADENKFKSDYFMWIDGGAFNAKYLEDGLWNGWTGHIDARPTRCRFCVAPTMGKQRPGYVPQFVYRLYTKLFTAPIQDATAQSLARQSMQEIALINADYDVPAGSFIIPKNLVNNFYDNFETTRLIMKRHGLVSVEQAVFQTMMKFDVSGLFEICYIRGYTGLYAAIAKKDSDCLI